MRKASYLSLLVAAMFLSYLFGQRHTSKQTEARGAHRVLYWVDPMHPSYKSEKPGIAPDCGMQLEPVYADDLEKEAMATATSKVRMTAGAVNINKERQQSFGIEVAMVKKSSGMHSLRLPGRVETDETRVYRINAGVDGYIRETYQDTVGSQVKKDQRLATLYGPEFLSVAGGYISTIDRTPGAISQTALRGSENWADRLRNLGMSNFQINELAETKKLPEVIYMMSPVDGFVLARNVSPGLKFDRGTEFYRIADLERVWIVADVYENDAESFHPGTLAQVTLPGQGKVFPAVVSDVLPRVDPTTRTLKLRLDADNPGYALRPEMFVDVELKTRMAAGISIPQEAVLDSGMQKIVYVETREGVFEPRPVKIGEVYGSRVSVSSGLSAGDRIVTSGNFLVDSESRLRSTAVVSSNRQQDDQQHVASSGIHTHQALP
jgi:multidrug efflux pump subunit AcrA (membrane-fusion protein)